MAKETADDMTCLVYLSTGRLETGIQMAIIRVSMTEVREMIVKRILLRTFGLDSILADRIQTKCIVACNASMRNSSYLNGQCFIQTKQCKSHGIWSYREVSGCGGGCSATIIWIKDMTRDLPAEIWELVMDYI